MRASTAWTRFRGGSTAYRRSCQGFWGSHLGVVDLTLKREGERWIVEEAVIETRPIYRREGGAVRELGKPDAQVTASIAPAHKGTLAWVEQPAGAIDTRVHSYLCGQDTIRRLRS